MSHGQQYSPNIRLFSLRQQFYSNAAYESLRTYFNNHLPSKRTLQKWYSSVDGAPGININALNIIREKADFYEAEHGFPLHLTKCLHLFDILNFGEGRSSNNEYKQPLSNDTVDIIFSYLKDVEAYIKCLMIKVHSKNETIMKPVFKSRAQMGFYGFHIDIISLIGIYNDFVRDGPLNIFHPFQFSQDHLETLFSLIRNSQGRNDNPSPTEFASAFRKIMICHPLITSRDHNVITNATGILTVPCRSKKRQQSKNFIHREDLFNINYTEMISQETMAMDECDKHICAFVALCIEKRIFREERT